MPKIMEYDHENSFLDDDVLLKDGENGTHIITAKDAGLALLNLTNGSEVFYAVCTTGGDAQEKEISLDDFTLGFGSAIVVNFTSTNTASAPTLKIDDNDAVNINYEGAPIDANLFLESHSYLMVYDGSVFNVVGDIADSFLKDYVRIDSIVDDLESDSTTAPLSAAQGKELKSQIDAATNTANNAAPINHASAEETYGLGSEDLYGHTKLTDTYTRAADSAATAVSSKGIAEMYKTLNDRLSDLENDVESGVMSGKILGDEETLEDYANSFDEGEVFIFSIPEGHESNPAETGVFLGVGLKLVSTEDAEENEKAAIFVGHADETDGFYYGTAIFVKHVDYDDEEEIVYYTLDITWTLDDFSAEVGTVTTGEAGTEAEVENVGTSKHVILDFTIPKGDKGDSFDITEDAYFDALDSFASTELRRTTFRGKNLGTAVTDEQWAEITAGTFKGLFCGDYWVINGYNWRIVDFDYWYKQGDTSFTSHHILVMPDAYLYTAQMNDSNTTEGAYVGSQMYTANLADAKTAFNSAFGSSHVLTHREYLQNAITSGYPSAGSWYDSTVELPNEEMMYGSIVRQQSSSGGTNVNNATVSKTQLALMALNPYWINPNRQTQWLRDVVSAANFARVYLSGSTGDTGASSSHGVRPVAAIG